LDVLLHVYQNIEEIMIKRIAIVLAVIAVVSLMVLFAYAFFNILFDKMITP
jgi:uncharacterized membrane protein YqjE